MLVDLVYCQCFVPFLQYHHLLQIDRNILKKEKALYMLQSFWIFHQGEYGEHAIYIKLFPRFGDFKAFQVLNAIQAL